MITFKTMRYTGVAPVIKALTSEQQALVDSYFEALDIAAVVNGDLAEAYEALDRLLIILQDFPPNDQQIVQQVYYSVSNALEEMQGWSSGETGAGSDGRADYWHITGNDANYDEIEQALTAKTVKLMGVKSG